MDKNKEALCFHWPDQAMTLGNHLVFRKEVELLLQANKREKAYIYFAPESISFNVFSFFSELLESSKLFLHPQFKKTEEKIVWPPSDKMDKLWNYGSFKRLDLLVKRTGIFPELLWKSSLLTQLKKIYKELTKEKNPLITVHLKHSSDRIDESNANQLNWYAFFKNHPTHIFFLIGEDKSHPSFKRLENLFFAKEFPLSISSQLAFCSLSDGFMGMASGPCNSACLSRLPYVIFKDPKHHAKEMQMELGNNEHLPFALPWQKIWRKKDTLENLEKAFEILSSAKVVQ